MEKRLKLDREPEYSDFRQGIIFNMRYEGKNHNVIVGKEARTVLLQYPSHVNMKFVEDFIIYIFRRKVYGDDIADAMFVLEKLGEKDENFVGSSGM